MITVFTPTYNRAYSLRRLFSSLREQTFKDFEWLIVDDGSKDNTESLIFSFQKECSFDIRYVRKENGGKHRAINYGVKLARGDWFFILDSDDWLPHNALQIVDEESKDVATSAVIAGVAGNRIFPNGLRVGGQVSYKTIISNPVDIRYKYKVKGDLVEVWKTSVLRQYPFPEYKGEKFMEEAVVWFRIAEKYQLKYFNRPIYCCEYLQDGLTRNIRKVHRESPFGSKLYCLEMIRNKRVSLIGRLKATVNYWRYTLTCNGYCPINLRPMWWMYLFLPVGAFFYWHDMKIQ